MSEPLSKEELEKLDVRVGGLQNVNREIVKEINNSGAAIDIVGARIESLTEFLTEAGIITFEQRLREQEAWELKFRERLKPLLETVREARRAQGAPVQTGSGLILPGR